MARLKRSTPEANRRPPSEITSNDVAKSAGVSQTTVSRTFRSADLVTPDTREKVLDAAQALGYRPHALARSLITGRSRIIGVVVSNEYKDYYGTILAELSRKLELLGYHIMSFIASEHIADHEPMIRTMLEYRIDGLVMGSIDMSSNFAEECIKANIPVVLYNRHQENKEVSSINTDDYVGGRTAAKLLVEFGHQRISMIVGRENSSTSIDRERGFVEGLQAHGRNIFSRAVGNYNAEAASSAAQLLLGRSAYDRPDGVFVASDTMAVAVMEVARFSLGIRVPEDLSVVGFDDIPLAALPSFSLTTYHLPLNRMVAAAVRVLVDQIDSGKMTPQQITIAGHMVERGSVMRRGAAKHDQRSRATHRPVPTPG